jgi:GTP pyrophosphokinase
MYNNDPEQEKKEILNRYRDLLRVWKPANEEDKLIVRKAFNFAAEAHKKMRRKSGEPYIYHPLEVARIVAEEIGLGKTSIICALLHDVVEDTDFTLADIEIHFGKNVAKIIDGLTKIEDIFENKDTTKQLENFRKMLLTLSDDVRVILIKLADRLHNMRTLESMPNYKQLKIASETIYLYAPLAHRFGLYSIKSELEDLSLKYTEPEIYKNISERLKQTELDRKRFFNRFIYPIKKSLAKLELPYEIYYRDKSIYSIWQKTKKKGITIEEVYDLFAVRIILESKREDEKVDCWRIYSIITDYYRPNSDRLRDWVSLPKANGYEALHTTVMSKDGQWVEVQIRTKRMDEIAEKGFAAHWRYKEQSASRTEQSINRWLERIRDMLQSSETNALDFVNDFQGFLFTDEIYVFTPKGELRNLPFKSTVLDFAYAIHSELGNTCIGAKVNHKLAPLNYRLKSGDQVEVISSSKQIPKEEWFNYIITARAKTALKQAIKDEKKKFAEAGGKKLETIFKQLNIDYNEKNLARLQKKYNYTSPVDLYYDVANNLIGLKEIKACCAAIGKGGWFSIITKPFTKTKETEQKTLTETIIEELMNQSGVLEVDTEIPKISFDIANCCMPVPGDEVVGFINPDKAVKIHRTSCPEAIDQMSKFENKIIKTIWHDKETISFITGIKISGVDKKGLINDVIKIITEELNLNIQSFHLEANGGIINGTIMFYVYSTKNLASVIKQLKKNHNIKSTQRIDYGFDSKYWSQSSK